ncbi:unnamed protein product, partial [Echinostoma caproni]
MFISRECGTQSKALGKSMIAREIVLESFQRKEYRFISRTREFWETASNPWVTSRRQDRIPFCLQIEGETDQTHRSKHTCEHFTKGIACQKVCDRCQDWYHQRCSNLTKQDYQLPTKHEILKWTCTRCAHRAADPKLKEPVMRRTKKQN